MLRGGRGGRLLRQRRLRAARSRARRLPALRRAGHRALADRHRRRRAAPRGRAAWRPARSSRACVSPGALSARKGVNVTYARPELPAITEKDVADLALAAELGADFVALSFVRTAEDIEQLRGAHGRAVLPGAGGREDREGRGLRAARRDHRGRRRHHGRARRLRRRGRRRARAADAEGHDRPRHAGRQAGDHGDADARVDDPRARADARRGDRRRQRGDRRHLGRDAVGRDERRQLPGRGGAGDGRDRRGGRARARDPRPGAHASGRTPRRRPSCTPPSSSPQELDAVALVVPTATGGAPRACAKYRSKLPDHRARARPPRRRPDHARMGRLLLHDGRRRVRRRA